ncbi:MAG: hypothetical protein IPP72_14615 [Chitinophagaceae bacterium]|nr:hypothetical protein [Chitinophagaceae bacterium]
MRPVHFFIAVFIFLVTGCTDTNEKPEGKSGHLPDVDSISLVNKVDTKELVDLSETRNIPELLCQGWELEDDLEVIRDNSEAQGVYPFRSFYFATDYTFIKIRETQWNMAAGRITIPGKPLR